MSEFKTDKQQESSKSRNFEGQSDGLGKSFAPPPFQLTASAVQRKTEETEPVSTEGPITLSGTVGVKGKNYVKDVKAIQKKLKEMGYLTEDALCIESELLLAKLKDTDTIEWGKIPLTIAAIKECERVVEYKQSTNKYDKPTGLISNSGSTLQLMNGQIPKPSQQDIKDIKANLKASGPTVLVGGPLNLSGPVGNTSSGNKKSDLIAIQQRLASLGTLNAGIVKKMLAETPDKIQSKYPCDYDDCMDVIKPTHIPETIKAITSFQTTGDLNHSVWNKRKFKGIDMSKFSYTNGIITPGDLSEFILTNFKKYKFSFTDDQGNPQSESTSNFPKSDQTKDAGGVSIAGHANPQSFSIQEFKSFGISDLEARALLFVSKNEGVFNAVNTYDKAKVSFGFVQFAGGTGQGSLPIMLANLKKDTPAVFKSKFQKFGIDVEFVEKDGSVKNATVVAIDPSQDGKVLRGLDAEAYISRATELVPAFLSAGYDKDVQRAQVKTAVTNYVVPSRSIKFNDLSSVSYLKYKKEETVNGAKVKKDILLVGQEAINFFNGKDYASIPEADKEKLTKLSLSGESISDYLSSEKARAVIIDQCINRGLGGGTETISLGMRDYILNSKNIDKATLKTDSEVDILEKIKPNAKFPERVELAINDPNLAS